LLDEARAYIAELKRQLFGPKADKLTPEQEEQLRQVAGDLKEQAQRPAPVSQEVLEPGLARQGQRKLQRSPRQRRHPLAGGCNWKCSAWCWNPTTRFVDACQQPGQKIGEEVTTEYEYLAAKLICKETVPAQIRARLLLRSGGG